ncbi:MAG: sulfurtransferase TusA family protein [Alcanivoracaceae bacterium]|nr:sulfurtransferase TusA family protein [Alcanivoracaceae bacterium]
MTVETLDARRLLCPMPVIRTQNRVREMAPGEELEVICTDPGALADIPAWCRVHGHEVVQAGPGDGNEVVVRLRVGNG